jgi:hypothetical protein
MWVVSAVADADSTAPSLRDEPAWHAEAPYRTRDRELKLRIVALEPREQLARPLTRWALA